MRAVLRHVAHGLTGGLAQGESLLVMKRERETVAV